jgi:hypothetical protein
MRRHVKGGLVYDPTPEQQAELQLHRQYRRIVLIGGIQVPGTAATRHRDTLLTSTASSAASSSIASASTGGKRQKAEGHLSSSLTRLNSSAVVHHHSDSGFCDPTVVHQLCLLPLGLSDGDSVPGITGAVSFSRPAVTREERVASVHPLPSVRPAAPCSCVLACVVETLSFAT